MRTSCTYASRPALELGVDEDEDEGGRRGAVRIAEGWSRTSIFGLEDCEKGCEDERVEGWLERTFGAWKTRSKSSRTNLRIRWACKK